MSRKFPCEVLERVSLRLAEWQRAQPAVGEESLTDWLLFELSTSLPQVRYLKFSRHQEARVSGADWEWWFLFRGGCFGARVQAKRIQVGGDQYPGLAYANAHGLQIEKLRSDAAANGLPAFYLHYSTGSVGGTPRCGRGPSTSGAFLASASELYDSFLIPGRRKIADAELISFGTAVECIFCCPLLDPGGLPGLSAYLQQYFGAEVGRGGEQLIGMRGEPPSYVLAVAASERAARDALRQAEAPNVDGVVAFDFRES